MTVEEWQEKINNCESEADLKYLLKNKPKGAKAVKTGVPVLTPGGQIRRGGLNLLNSLQGGGRGNTK